MHMVVQDEQEHQANWIGSFQNIPSVVESNVDEDTLVGREMPILSF